MELRASVARVVEEVRDSPTHGKRKLNLGCGPGAPVLQEWINLDGSWNARLAKHRLLRHLLRRLGLVPQGAVDMPWAPDVLIHDVTRPLPFEDDSLQAIYASHLLEHLYLDEATHLLRDCFRVLEPNGILRIVVPDLRSILMEYFDGTPVGKCDGSEIKVAADRLNEQLGFRPRARPSGNVLVALYAAWKDFHSHKWMYDSESLCLHVRSAGFVEVAEMLCHVSRIEGIEAVEQAGRVLDGAGICVEGVKRAEGDMCT